MLNASQSSAPPVKIVKCGECGDNVTYTLDENGVLTIAGRGSMRDYSGAMKAPWHEERETIARVEIRRGVTTIGGYAFAYCAELTSVAIPDGVTTIGEYAFTGCAALASVTIPDSVTTIRWSAFEGCAGLTRVSVPARAKVALDAFPSATRVTRRK